jgi:MFS family permease
VIRAPVAPPRPLALGALFGVLYFVQGACEPTEGLLAQPVRASLLGAGSSAGEVARMMAIVAIPWSLKPLFGLAVDLVPIAGARRRPWLILATAAATIGSAALAVAAPPPSSGGLLMMLLVVPSIGIALGDVATDALMVETAQPRGLTGVMQSVQWGASYGATVVIGALAGWLTARGEIRSAYVLAALLASLSLAVAIFVVREPPRGEERPSVAAALRAATRREVLLAALFLLLLAWNPFTSTIQYVHVTGSLGLSDEHYGQTVSLFALAAVVASVGYGALCRRVPLRALAHASIVMGVIATVAYLLVRGEISSFVVTVIAGLTWTTALLVQMDLAARACPPAYAASVFALLMAVSNLGDLVATYTGGWIYDALSPAWGAEDAFEALVGIGASTTLLAWALVPRLVRAVE